MLDFALMPLLSLLQLQIILHELVHAHYVLRFFEEIIFFFPLVIFLDLIINFLELILPFLNKYILIKLVLSIVEKGPFLSDLLFLGNIWDGNACVLLHFIKYLL